MLSTIPSVADSNPTSNKTMWFTNFCSEPGYPLCPFMYVSNVPHYTKDVYSWYGSYLMVKNNINNKTVIETCKLSWKSDKVII